MSKIGDKLLEAVIKKNKSQLTRLLTEFPIDVSDFLYMDGWSLLHFSITTNDVDIILILLRHGIDVNIQSKEMRRTALHEAVLSNRMEIVRLLIDSGANPNLTDADRNTAIHLSVDYGYV
jgi:ankyrin repeat protein